MTDSAETAYLLEQASLGSDLAYAELLSRMRSRLLVTIERRLNPRLVRRIDASDIVQEVYLEALRRRDDYLTRRPMPFSLWLMKTAHQRLLKVERAHIRAAKRSVDRELPLPDASSLALGQYLSKNGTSASGNFALQESAGRVRRSLAQLSETAREIILLRNFQGLSNTDAAHLLEITEDASKKRYTRAVLQLQKILFADTTGESRS